MTSDPDPADSTDNDGVETNCQNRYDNGRAIQSTVWPVLYPTSGKGYVVRGFGNNGLGLCSSRRSRAYAKHANNIPNGLG